MVGASPRVGPVTANGSAFPSNGFAALGPSQLQDSPLHDSAGEERRLSRRDVHYLCYNITTRRAAGAVALITVLTAFAVVAISATALASVLTDDERCQEGEVKQRHSCLSLFKTSRIVHCLTLTDGVVLFFVSLVLFMGVLKESAGLIVPYLMWVKMSASVGVVVIIFLATNYKLAQVGTQLTLHMLLMIAHAICFHVVHEYDTQLMREMMSTSSVMLVPAG